MQSNTEQRSFMIVILSHAISCQEAGSSEASGILMA